MSKISIIFLFIFASVLQAKTLIISDIDDTIRQTNNLKLGGFTSSFLSGKAFEQMSRIYADFATKIPEVQFVYLTAAPRMVYNASKWTKNHNFPRGTVIQRPMFEDTLEFKVSEIMQILEQQDSSVEELILFGDNASEDPNVYKTVCQQVLIKCHGYIRDVRVSKVYDLEAKKWLGLVTEGHLSYYLSEMDLVAASDQTLSTNTLYSISHSFNQGTLIPNYIWDTLKKRVGKNQINSVILDYNLLHQ